MFCGDLRGEVVKRFVRVNEVPKRLLVHKLILSIMSGNHRYGVRDLTDVLYREVTAVLRDSGYIRRNPKYKDVEPQIFNHFYFDVQFYFFAGTPLFTADPAGYLQV